MYVEEGRRRVEYLNDCIVSQISSETHLFSKSRYVAH